MPSWEWISSFSEKEVISKVGQTVTTGLDFAFCHDLTSCVVS
jgi:phage terminase large subunit-like protein